MAGRMAGAMGDTEPDAAEFQFVAIVQVAVGFDVPAIGDAVSGALGFQFVEQPLIVFVRADDRAARAL